MEAVPVLVVEDDPYMRSMLGTALRRGGYDPTIVDSGSAALHVFATTAFAAVLVDYGVRVQSGHRVIAHIQQCVPPPVLILMTGQSWESLADQLARVPLAAFLPKPFSLSTLYATLARSLSGGRGNAPSLPAG